MTLVGSWSPAASGPAGPRRIAFIVDSWYRWSHADVIGTRFLEGYRVGNTTYTSPLTVGSVFPDAPYERDLTQLLASRYGFRVAASIPDALLDDPRSPRPRFAADGVLIATREDLPDSGQRQSPHRRLQVAQETFRLMDQTGTFVPVFIDKMLASSWADSQTIVAEAARRRVSLMAGSVLPHTPLSRPLRVEGVAVGVVIAHTPYWAFAFHAAELLQSFLEKRAHRETGVREIREVGIGFWSLPDRERWGGRVVDALLASPRTLSRRAPAVPAGLGSDTVVVLIQYIDGTRGVLALIPGVFDDSEFLLGAQYRDGSISTSGIVLPGEPYDHFGYLVHALVEFFTTGRAPVPVQRTLLTTGIVLFGLESRQTGRAAISPGLEISYAAPPARP
ncbi:MAG: hypothetical protein QN168_04330 [Armatimonadota bacterium]|nr:hypothetical protein [Armatimonadota bacterium]